MKKNPYKKFVLLFFLTFLIPAFAIACFNWIIDPFGYFLSPPIKNVNFIKISLEKQQRLHKSLEITRQKPEVILLGSSRVMAGMDPEDVYPLAGGSVYNAGFAGASIEEIYYYFEHALHHQPQLKRVLLGIDLFAFGKNKRPQKDFSVSKLGGGTFDLKHFLAILWSKTTLKSSYETLQANYFKEPSPFFLPTGLSNPVLVESPQNEFLTKGDLEFIKIIFQNTDFYYGFQLGQDKIDWFKRLVGRCQEKRIALNVFICPSKAIYWESLHQKGLWPDLEKLKRQISAIYPVWDFSGFNCVTTETIKKEGAPLYYECSHFRPYTGRLILAKLFGKEEGPADFGYYLNSESVEEALKQIKQDRLNWLETKPPVIAELSGLQIEGEGRYFNRRAGESDEHALKWKLLNK